MRISKYTNSLEKIRPFVRSHMESNLFWAKNWAFLYASGPKVNVFAVSMPAPCNVRDNRNHDSNNNNVQLHQQKIIPVLICSILSPPPPKKITYLLRLLFFLCIILWNVFGLVPSLLLDTLQPWLMWFHTPPAREATGLLLRMWFSWLRFCVQ